MLRGVVPATSCLAISARAFPSVPSVAPVVNRHQRLRPRGGIRSDGSALDALAAGIGAENLEPLAALADGIDRTLDWLVDGVPLDIEEEEVGGVALSVPLGERERLDPGHVD